MKKVFADVASNAVLNQDGRDIKSLADRLSEKVILEFLNKEYQISFSNYHDLHHWSVNDQDTFWASIAGFFSVDFSLFSFCHQPLAIPSCRIRIDTKFDFQSSFGQLHQ